MPLTAGQHSSQYCRPCHWCFWECTCQLVCKCNQGHAQNRCQSVAHACTVKQCPFVRSDVKVIDMGWLTGNDCPVETVSIVLPVTHQPGWWLPLPGTFYFSKHLVSRQGDGTLVHAHNDIMCRSWADTIHYIKLSTPGHTDRCCSFLYFDGRQQHHWQWVASGEDSFAGKTTSATFRNALRDQQLSK